MPTEKMLLDGTGQQIVTKLDDIALAISASSYGDFTWQKLRQLVRSGQASKVYPIGTILPKINHSVYGDIYWRIEDYYTDANGLKRAKLWSMYQVVGSLQYDASEAFYYANSALSAGTYNFIIATTDGDWTAGTYKFTLTQTLPAGGQLVFSTYSGAITSVKVYAFASRTTTTKTEECVITAGSGGTNLGTLGTTLNHIQRVKYGSNNWKQSAVRQFLNSNAAAGSVWVPQTKYDRPPSWAGNTAGFMAGLPADFLAVVAPTVVKCATNDVFETDMNISTAYTVNDYFYMPSTKEVYGVNDGTLDGSTQYPLFVNTDNASKIKYTTGGTQVSYYWLRSAYPWNARGVRLEYTPYGGAMYGNDALGARAVLPACDI